VIRISLPYIYQLASVLEQLENVNSIDDGPEAFFLLSSAKHRIEALLEASVFGENIRSSRDLADQLIGHLSAEIDKAEAKDTLGEYSLDDFAAYLIKDGFEQFKIAFLAELNILPSYFVSQKGGYDTEVLISRGENIFPASLYAKVPEATFDAAEAGKALAFEMPTACGFHTFRSLEAVVRRYFTHVTGGQATPKVRSLGTYIAALKKSGKADDKILGALVQLKDLHRNPLIHPDAVLTNEEAVTTVGLACSAMQSMLNVLQMAEPTTTAH